MLDRPAVFLILLKVFRDCSTKVPCSCLPLAKVSLTLEHPPCLAVNLARVPYILHRGPASDRCTRVRAVRRTVLRPLYSSRVGRQAGHRVSTSSLPPVDRCLTRSHRSRCSAETVLKVRVLQAGRRRVSQQAVTMLHRLCQTCSPSSRLTHSFPLLMELGRCPRGSLCPATRCRRASSSLGLPPSHDPGRLRKGEMTPPRGTAPAAASPVTTVG